MPSPPSCASTPRCSITFQLCHHHPAVPHLPGVLSLSSCAVTSQLCHHLPVMLLPSSCAVTSQLCHHLQLCPHLPGVLSLSSCAVTSHFPAMPSPPSCATIPSRASPPGCDTQTPPLHFCNPSLSVEGFRVLKPVEGKQALCPNGYYPSCLVGATIPVVQWRLLFQLPSVG